MEVSFSSSKSLNPSILPIRFGKYELTTLPTVKNSLGDTREIWSLKFDDVWLDNQMHSFPQKESEYILSFLSLLCESKIQYIACKSDNVQSEIRQNNSSSYLDGKIEAMPGIEEALQKMCSMDSELLRQFLRSCNAYQTSLTLIEDNPTLAFFLLVTSIEAISGKVIQKSDRVNFKEFISKYLPTEFWNEIGNRNITIKLINEAYNMRCAFTHGGTNISIGSMSAEESKRNYVKHYVEGKEVLSPSLRWFQKIVHAVLLTFLGAQTIKVPDERKLSEIAKEGAIITLKIARAGLKPGRVVTSNDLDLDADKSSSV